MSHSELIVLVVSRGSSCMNVLFSELIVLIIAKLADTSFKSGIWYNVTVLT